MSQTYKGVGSIHAKIRGGVLGAGRRAGGARHDSR